MPWKTRQTKIFVVMGGGDGDGNEKWGLPVQKTVFP
jgi:hypothetical protein